MKPFTAVALLCLASANAATAQSPTATQLSQLRLHDGFTLVYQVTMQDVRTPALRQKDMTEQQAGIAKAVAEGHIAKNMQGDYEKQALELGQLQPVEQFYITLSAREGKLLYLSTRGARNQRDGTKTALVLDGDKEYEADDPTGAIINNDGWRTAPAYHGENVDRLAFCPLPGVGLPGVDLIQSPIRAGVTSGGHFRFTGLVPRLNVITGGESPYKLGEVEAVVSLGRLKVVSLTVGTSALPVQTWRFTAFQLVQGHWVGSTMRMTNYEAALADASEKLVSDLPTFTVDYQLREKYETAQEASAFDIGTYLAKGASVSDNSTGNTLTFTFDPKGGSLKEQAERAQRASKIAEPKRESEKVTQTPPVVILEAEGTKVGTAKSGKAGGSTP